MPAGLLQRRLLEWCPNLVNADGCGPAASLQISKKPADWPTSLATLGLAIVIVYCEGSVGTYSVCLEYTVPADHQRTDPRFLRENGIAHA